MKNPNEIFTYPLSNKSSIAQDTVNNHSCRFTGSVCIKKSRMIKYPMGVCSVNYSKKKTNYLSK